MEPGISETNQDLTGKDMPSISREIFESIYQNVQEGILLFDNRGCLIDINPEGMKIHEIELTAKEFYQNNPFVFFRLYNADHQELSEDMGPVARLLNRESFRKETYIVKLNENESELRISYTAIPHYDRDGTFSGGILFAQNPGERNIQSELTKNVFAHDEHSKQLEIYQQHLKDEKELLQLIIDAFPVMVTIYDKKIPSVAINQAFKNITGWTNEEIICEKNSEPVFRDPTDGKTIISFFPFPEPGFQDIRIRTPEGRFIDASWSNLELPDGRLIGIGIDISERKSFERALINSKKKAELENQVQFAFIQNISHEVRTPMNSILGFTELLQKEVSDKKESEFLNAISYNGKQLLRLIDDIIDFSELENNRISIKKGKIYLSALMNNIEMQMEKLRNDTKKSHLTLTMLQPKDKVQVLLNTDDFRLQQVLSNLIGNALKYTEKGTVEVGYEIRKNKQDILFYVKDTGIGIDSKNKNKVFKQFSRLHNVQRQEFRGTGLGLAICRHLVNALGGEIWFESKPTGGTVFYFTHPYQQLENIDPEKEVNQIRKEVLTIDSNLPDLEKKVILIVEDDSFSYMMMYHMLKETKALILHADTGRKAIEIFNKYKADLVFLDIRLPEMDGFEIIRYMHQVNNKIPVIAQTANALPEDREKIKNAGFNFHLTKPITRDSLISVLNRFL